MHLWRGPRSLPGAVRAFSSLISSVPCAVSYSVLLRATQPPQCAATVRQPDQNGTPRGDLRGDGDYRVLGLLEQGPHTLKARLRPGPAVQSDVDLPRSPPADELGHTRRRDPLEGAAVVHGDRVASGRAARLRALRLEDDVAKKNRPPSKMYESGTS